MRALLLLLVFLSMAAGDPCAECIQSCAVARDFREFIHCVARCNRSACYSRCVMDDSGGCLE